MSDRVKAEIVGYWSDGHRRFPKYRLDESERIMPQECDHPEFEARAEVSRLRPATSVSFPTNLVLQVAVDVQVYCVECEEPVQFNGPQGVDPGQPMVSADRREARLPGLVGNYKGDQR